METLIKLSRINEKDVENNDTDVELGTRKNGPNIIGKLVIPQIRMNLFGKQINNSECLICYEMISQSISKCDAKCGANYHPLCLRNCLENDFE